MAQHNISNWVKAAGLGVLLLFVSCSGEKKKYVIPERKFVDLLVDLHLAEGVVTESRRMEGIEYEIDSASLYGSVYRKHNVSKAMFDSTMMFYSRRPERFKKIYNNVSRHLQSMEQQLIEEEKLAEQEKVEVLWKSDTTYVFRMGGDKVEIAVPLQGPGQYNVSATVKIMPDDGSVDPRMTLYFWRDDGTEEGMRIPFNEVRFIQRTGRDRTYRTFKSLDSTNYTLLRGYIANYSNPDSNFSRNMVVRDIVVSKTIDK